MQGPRKQPPVDGLRGRGLAAIRNAMIEKKLTQADLADAADCHEKTIQNLLAGKSVRMQTLFDVCMVLGIDFDAVKLSYGREGSPDAVPESPESGGGVGQIAPTYMGAYSRAGVDQYIGSYLTLRPSFSDPTGIVAYRTDIAWDPEWPSLVFEERDRPDRPFSHRGRLYIPASSSFIHLVSLTKGAMRMVLISQIDQTGSMRGLISTLHKRAASFVPISAPIVYQRQADFAPGDLGDIAAGHARHAGYREMLVEAERAGYARIVTVAGRPPE